MLDPDRLRAAYEQVKAELLAERTPDGHWVGELSSSALSTATAVSALAVVRRQGTGDLENLISRGVTYLAAQQNDDGGFGDTDLSHSNIATTYLVVAALHLADVVDQHADLLTRAQAYIDGKGGLDGLRERYGIDKTFVVPIMTNLALAGLLDWRLIDPLPFELACVPQSLYRFVGMPVVSYAIPALVAIGQARYFHAPPWNPLTRLVRWLSISRSLKVLRRMQPDSGGYLEATPLTAFVVMSLASVTKPRPVVGVSFEQSSPRPTGPDATTPHLAPRPMVGALNPTADEVIGEAVKFLASSIRPDGSWPIDTNLATWNTTLAINALAGAGEDVAQLLAVGAVDNALRGVPDAPIDDEPANHAAAQMQFPTRNVVDWLLSCQHTKRHPFTGANPGGFGWSDLSGAVPDADDTPGALISLCHLRERHAWGFARNWLIRIQNADGGWPTFCKGWGRLPFDRSGTDLTAHAVRALRALGGSPDTLWGNSPDGYFEQLYRIPVDRGLSFLTQTQHPAGSWSPLWFGNQDHPEEDNPVYGTAKVLFAYRDLGLMDSPEAQHGVAWLVANQNADGGWGSGAWGKRARNAELGAASGVLSTEYSVPGTPAAFNRNSKILNLKSSVEETALAAEALLAALPGNATEGIPYTTAAALEKGLTWLVERVERGEHRQPAPIGFYFAKLWYYEKLYPLTFTAATLGRACRQFAHPVQLDSHADPAPARVP